MDDNSSKKRTGRKSKLINVSDDDFKIFDLDVMEEPRKDRMNGGTSKHMTAFKSYADEEQFIELNDFPSFEEMSDSSLRHKKTKSKKIQTTAEQSTTFIGQKRGRGRPPKNNTKKTPVQVSDDLLDLPSSFDADLLSDFIEKDEPCKITIDKDNIPSGIELIDDSTAILSKPVKNEHRVIFGNVDADRDLTWSVKINNLAERGWMSMGLCNKQHYINTGNKFNKADSHAFLISANGITWNANVLEQNDRGTPFPKLTTNSVVEMKYSHKDKTLTFKNGSISTKLTTVAIDDQPLTPCVIFLNNKDDSASFI
jgi:hypothetical protein